MIVILPIIGWGYYTMRPLFQGCFGTNLPQGIAQDKIEVYFFSEESMSSLAGWGDVGGFVGGEDWVGGGPSFRVGGRSEQ